jgi:hypothetical protein
MILDPHIRQVVNESGRREITIDMITEAERRRANGVPVFFTFASPSDFVLQAFEYLREMEEEIYKSFEVSMRDIGSGPAQFGPTEEYLVQIEAQNNQLRERCYAVGSLGGAVEPGLTEQIFGFDLGF